MLDCHPYHFLSHSDHLYPHVSSNVDESVVLRTLTTHYCAHEHSQGRVWYTLLFCVGRASVCCYVLCAMDAGVLEYMCGIPSFIELLPA